MTSFTRKLFHKDPAAAVAIHRLTYGKNVELACFTPSSHGMVPAFGKRLPSGQKACDTNCRHPACARGCTLR